MSAEDSVPPDRIATLRIDLLDSDPPIWREIEVPVSMTLKELHAVVQAAMEWEDAHLWKFAVGRERFQYALFGKCLFRELTEMRRGRFGG
jgi:hypothetical protein